MKPLKSENARRNLLLGAAGLATLLTSGCALPSKEAWSQVRTRGLIPVLIDANRDEAVASTPVTGKPSEQKSVAVQVPKVPAIVKVPSADFVSGKPGFVYSPHTSPRKVVDIRGFKPGEEVRCPYTSQPFIVPGLPVVVSNPSPAPVHVSKPVSRPVTRVVSNEPTLAPVEKLEPIVEHPPVVNPPAPVDPVKPVTKPAPPVSAESSAPVPYGTRVPGRPGFVYSPHAGKTQLVDVAGNAPGVVMKCPYTNKLFRVPEPVSEEIKPQTFPPVPTPPATETAGSPPPPEKKEASHGKPTGPSPANSANQSLSSPR